MDVESTIEFLLQQQGSFEARLTKIDRRIDAITKLVQTGMKKLVRVQEDQRDLGKEMQALAAAQRGTERRLQTFINAMERRYNGRGKNPPKSK